MAGAANFGIAGSGRLFILRAGGVATAGGMECEMTLDAPDALYDCSWSELEPEFILTACGDGSVSLWNLQTRRVEMVWRHGREVFGVDWNVRDKQLFVSSSWDQSVCVWTPTRKDPVKVLKEPGCVYQCRWSPAVPDLMASASADGTVKVYSMKKPGPVVTIPAHVQDTLSVDWNKYDTNLIASASVDRTIKVFDIRYPDREVWMLAGHQLAVRRVCWSPHQRNLLASVSYDTTVRLWELPDPQPSGQLRPTQPVCRVMGKHSEFAVGLDWNLFQRGELVSAAWDQQVRVYQC